jgi:hypothetical protein
MRMGVGLKNVLKFNHTFTIVRKCKEVNLKHSKMRSTLVLTIVRGSSIHHFVLTCTKVDFFYDLCNIKRKFQTYDWVSE